MAITDLVTLLLSFFFMVRGSARGFLNALINPFSITFTTYLSIIYYNATKNFLISIVIGTIGPIVLNILLKVLLKSWAKATNSDVSPDLLSRLGGGLVSLVWGWIFIIYALIFLALFPPLWGKAWNNAHNDAARSVSYNRIAKPLQKDFLALVTAGLPDLTNKISNTASEPSNPNSPEAASTDTNAEARSLANDPRFQKILQDPDIKEDIEAHDFTKLMSNPKVLALTQQIMSDPAALQKVMAIYKSKTIQPADPGAQATDAQDSTAPNTSN